MNKYLTLMLLCVIGGCGKSPEPTIHSSRAPGASASQSYDTYETHPDERAAESKNIKPRSQEDPVAVRLAVSQQVVQIGGAFEISAIFDMAGSYEIHGLDAGPPQIPTRLELELPHGVYAAGEWESPTPVRSLLPGGQPVHIGEARFTRTIRLSDDLEPGDYAIVCSVSYQACDSKQCLRPIRSVLEIQVSVVQ